MMKDSGTFQRFAAITAIVAFFTTVASNVLQGIPVNFHTDIPFDPRIFLSVDNSGGNLLRWGLILDMLGYYLPFLPIALFLQAWLKSKSSIWSSFYTTCGLGYIFIGAVGAVTIAVMQPPLIRAYNQAAPDQHQVVEMIFGAVWNIVYAGLWNILAVFLAGIWFVGVGLLLRSERRALAILAMIAGASALVDSFGNMMGITALAMVGLLLFLLLVPIWMLWLGIDLLRKPIRMRLAADPVSAGPTGGEVQG